MDERIAIGSNPLPIHVQEKLAELVGLVDEQFETRNGATALFWQLSYEIKGSITGGRP